MKEVFRKIVSILLMLLLVIGLLPMNNIIYANELDTQVMSNDNVKIVEENLSPYSNNVYSTIEEASEYMRDQMVKRQGTITFTVNKKYTSTMVNDILNLALEDSKECSSSEGDYLLGHYSGYKCNISHSSSQTTLKYTMSYLSTYSQEVEVDKKVKEVLDDLNVYDKDEYTKIKAVHDYIVKNIKYDYSFNNHSAYNAIVNKKSVCQGYATLTYKMLKELGVETRYITGTGNGENHGWNIVKIGSLWYNLDNTWDACYYESLGMNYTWFLKSNSDFSNHNRDSKYNTNTFNNNYPMSSSSYVYKKSGDINTLSISNIGSKTYTGSQIKPSVTVKDGSKTLVNNKDYALSYSNNTNIGTATITITGKGNYSGTRKIAFKIIPKTVTSVKQTSCTTSSIKLSWAKDSKVSGYQVYRATSKNGEYSKVATLSSYSKNYYTNSNLSSGKTYYYKIRAYKKVGSTTYYGNFSSVFTGSTKCSKSSITLTSPKTKTAKITWKKISGASGYKIYGATSKNGKYSLVKTVSSSSTSYTNTGLTKGKAYYYKIRAYKVVNNSNIYSDYSSVKSVKVK